MGACASKGGSTAATDRHIDKLMEEEQMADSGRIKLLLLGAGESGKSTIFKQMRILYGTGYPEESRLSMRSVIFENLLDGFRLVIDNVKGEVESSMQEHVQRIRNTPGTNLTHLTPEIHDSLMKLWSESEAFKESYARRSEYHLFDGFKHYAKKLKEYPSWGGEESFCPSIEDVLQSRVRTTGIIEETYLIQEVEFEIFDVGGQRNERRKWIHCFDGVTAIIFVASIAAYDQQLFEDGATNRMVEALDLFEEIVNSKWFINSDMILFLNKRDLFEEKWVQRKLPFPDLVAFKYAPKVEQKTENIPEMYEYFESMFTQKYLPREGHVKKIFAHCTCATDTNNVEKVMTACQQMLIARQLEDMGM